MEDAMRGCVCQALKCGKKWNETKTFMALRQMHSCLRALYTGWIGKGGSILTGMGRLHLVGQLRSIGVLYNEGLLDIGKFQGAMDAA